MPFGGHYRHKMEEIGGYFENSWRIGGQYGDMGGHSSVPKLDQTKSIDLQRKIIFNLWVECVLNCSQCVAE